MQALHREQQARFEHWLDDVNKICGPFAARLLDQGFDGSIQRIESSLELARVNASHTHIYRTYNELRGAGGEFYFFVLQARGHADMEQANNRSSMTPGDVILIDSTQPCNFYLGENSSQVSIIVPRGLVEQHLRPARAVCGTKVPAATSVAGMVNKLLAEAITYKDLNRNEGEAILEAMVTLMRPALADRYSEHDQHDRVFHKAVAYIDRYIGDPSLSSEWIAQHIGTSPRTLYRAFAEQSFTVAQYIRDRRLELFAAQIRQSPGNARLSSLGHELGLTDPSHLSTTFKAKFGMPPREYRRQFHQRH